MRTEQEMYELIIGTARRDERTRAVYGLPADAVKIYE
ncbi:aminoglycoside 6-adenylyltransferase [Clostridium sp. Marseille-P2415]